jgi:transcriptional regulator with XRE-family HTH domain
MVDKVKAAFGQHQDNLGWLVERDTRTLPEVLSAWMDYERVTSVIEMLTETGLIKIITETQFRNLHDGVQVPGPRLSTVMATHLPDGIMRSAKQTTFQPKFYGFQNAARRWRRSRESKSIGSQSVTELELQSAVFEGFSLSVLERLRTPAPADLAAALDEESPTVGKPSQAENIRAAFESFAAQQSVIRGYEAVSLEEILENLCMHYRRDPDGAINAIDTLLRGSGAQAVGEHEIESFLDSLQPVPGRTPAPAQALLFLRQVHNLTQDELATRIGVDPRAISKWETGAYPIKQSKLGNIAAALQLSLLEARRFILLARPDIRAHVGEEWLDATIRRRDWTTVSFPAFDSAWLNAQPADRQPGLLLHDLRVSKRLTKNELATRIGVNPKAISKWEGGTRPINPGKLGQIALVLQLSSTEAKRFILLARSDLIANAGERWLDGTIRRSDWTTVSFPALASAWLNAQPANRRRGLLLHDLRVSKRLTEKELAKRIGESGQTISMWECGIRPITLSDLVNIALALQLSSVEAKRFILLARPDIIAHVGEEWLDAAIRRRDWTTVSFPAFDSAWLNAQPADRQPSLLLHDLRVSKRLTKKELAKRIGDNRQTISMWECGTRPITPSKLGEIAIALQLSSVEAKRFILLARPDIIAHVGEEWLDTTIRRNDWTNVSFPTLDSAWLNAQPGDRQPGLLLHDLRLTKRLTEQELATRIGVQRQTISMWETGGPKINSAKLGEIALALRLSLPEAKRFILLARPEIIANIDEEWLDATIRRRGWTTVSFPALDSAWLNAQAVDKQSGLLLHDHRGSKRLNQNELAKRIGVDQQTISIWEAGAHPINPSKLGEIALALKLSLAEAKRFILLARPDIIANAGEKWLDTMIRRRGWTTVSFPALDSTWLNAQPVDRQPGLLLHDLRVSKHLTEKELAKRIGVDQQIISLWETRAHPITPGNLGEIALALELSLAEARRFILLTRPGITANAGNKWLDAAIRRSDWASISFPAFDSAWLNAQPADRQPGLLLHELRMSKRLTQNEFAKRVGVNQQTISLWESGTHTINPGKLGEIALALRLSLPEAKQFILLAQPDIIANVGEKWLDATIRRGDWTSISFPVFDSAWLTAQPANRRLGLVFHELRVSKRLTQNELATRIGVDDNTIARWEIGVNPISPNKLGEIALALRLSLPEAKQFILLARPDIIANVGEEWLDATIRRGDWTSISFPVFDSAWLNAQPADRQLGLVLHELRVSKRLTQNELATTIGVGQQTISMWETGIHSITPSKLGNIALALKLSSSEAKRFILLARPDIIANVGEEWLDATLRRKDWTTVSFPAFDSAWLTAQPADTQPGLLLHDLRLSKRSTQNELATKIGVDDNTISMWEGGTHSITPSKLGNIALALKLSSSEAKWFILLARPDIIANVGEEWLDATIRRRDWLTVSFPAFDSAWLNRQPAGRQPGLLLHDLRLNKRLTEKEFGTRVGVDQVTISIWESGAHPINPNKLEEIAIALQLSPPETEHFILLARPGIIANLGQKWLDATIRRGDWTLVSFPALDSAWLHAQPADRQPGLLLHDLRVSKQVSQAQLGGRIGVSKQTVNRWEAGTRAIPSPKLGELASIFTAAQAKQLILLVRPKIIEHVSASWLDAKISHADWEKISFPALDHAWLDGQPEPLQGGLLFRALRERADQTQSALFFSTGYLSISEEGRAIITDREISALQKAANFSVQEMARLRAVVARSNVAIKAIERLNQQNDRSSGREMGDPNPHVRQMVEHFGDNMLPAEAYETAIRRLPALLRQPPEKLIQNIETVYLFFADKGLKLSSYLKAAVGSPQLFTQSPETIIGNLNQIIAMYRDGIFRLPKGTLEASPGKPLEKLLEWLCHNQPCITRGQENTFLRYLLFADEADIPLPVTKAFLGAREKIERRFITKVGLHPDERSIASNRPSREALRQLTPEQRADYTEGLGQEQIRNLVLRAVLRADEMEVQDTVIPSKRGRQRDPRILTGYRMRGG